jgi:hypothetical protein
MAYSMTAALVCAGLTAAGLVLSWLAGRRRGLPTGLRGAAWSLLPLAAYLTGTVPMFWRIGTAIGSFAVSFVFSPLVWSGLIVTGLAVVLFVVSGTMRARRRSRARRAGPAVGPATGPATGPAGQPGRRAVQGKPARPAAGDDDFGEIAGILRKHGIK